MLTCFRTQSCKKLGCMGKIDTRQPSGSAAESKKTNRHIQFWTTVILSTVFLMDNYKGGSIAVEFAIDECFCVVSFQIPWKPTVALNGFLIYLWFRKWRSTISRKRLASKFDTFKLISTKSRVQLVDLLKECCKRRFFLTSTTAFER